jgi:hypothetical protein
MNRDEREELRHRVEDLHRDHPDWYARQIEAELASRSPVAYGSWVDETKGLAARLRSIQRWRGGGGGAFRGPLTGGTFPFVWPMGERQRQELEPTFQPSRVPRRGSSRLFLYNCGPEVVRDVRISLDGAPIGYAPALPVGRFSEIVWMKVSELRLASLSEGADTPSEHALSVDFVVGKGMHEARLQGTLVLDPSQGWRIFQAGESRSSEIE